MRFSKLLSIGLLTAFGLSAIAQSASADIVFKMLGDTAVWSGLTEYGKYVLTYSDSPKSVNKKANDCGFYKVSQSTTTPIGSTIVLQVDNALTTYTVANIPLEAAPKCSAGALSGVNLTPSEVLKDSEGNIYVTGLAPFGSNAVQYPNIPRTRKLTANACGVITAKEGSYDNIGAFILKTDGGTSVSTGTMATGSLTVGPGCKDGVVLLPPNWN